MASNASTTEPNSGYHREFGGIVQNLSSRVSLHVRRKMYRAFEASCGQPASVLDVGVTSSTMVAEANYFEEYFPHKDRITACGIEDAKHLERVYPGLKFVQLEEGKGLPFESRAFEVAFSNAVLEHVTDPKDRKLFLSELLRVSKKVFLTVPYRWFPVEHHTGLPFMHWLPIKPFFRLLKCLRPETYYTEKNLSFLTYRDLACYLDALGAPYRIQKVRFFGFVSNLVVTIER